MNLTLVTRLNAAGAALAEMLSATCSVLVLHPDPWDLEGSFDHRRIEKSGEAIPDSFNDADAIVYYTESDEMASLTLRMLQRAKDIPQLFLRSRGFYDTCLDRTVHSCICGSIRESSNANISYFDIPAVYGDDFLPQDIEEALIRSRKNNTLVLNGKPDTLCDVMHVEDLVSLIISYLDACDYHSNIMVTGNQRVPISMLADAIRNEYKFLKVSYKGEAVNAVIMQNSEGIPKNWMPVHSVLDDLPGVIPNLNKRSEILEHSKHRTLARGLRRGMLFAVTFACLWVYTNFIQVSSELQFVDVRLLFVIAMSLFLGRGYGLAAGLLCSISSVVDSLLSGYSWHTLFFHVDNWIPIAVYLASSVLFGMYHENNSRIEGDW